ncbi:MAG TPA: (Fe-S)-binding protein [Syntrophomonadaceae bacterium]|nr:(Fe-S)-binding protein [Syntrophomonadaceae bacterium]
MHLPKGLFSKTLEEACQDITTKCLDCEKCLVNCFLINEINERPREIAERKPTVDEAFSCALCGLCATMCTASLNIGEMFNLKRVEAIKIGQIDADDYCYIFPDRPETVMSTFRDYYKVDYSKMNKDIPSETAFLPGCTLMTYSPNLTKEIYETLAKDNNNPLFFEDCCGLTMYHIGLPERGDKIKESLREKARILGVKKIITACPNCYYQLKDEAAFKDIQILTVYEALKDHFVQADGQETYAVHDTCPDRFEGIFGKHVRENLDLMGYKRVELKNCGKNAVCCGSSGQLGHFRPELAKEHELKNIADAEEIGADILLSSCHACVLNLGDVDDRKVQIKHALNILLGFEEDYSQIKSKAGAMFEGEEGEELYFRLFDDPV